MDHLRIIRRAFDITRVYRALWLFGVLVALTASGARGSSGSGSNYSFDSRDFPPNGRNWPWNWDGNFPSIPTATLNSIIGIIIAVVCILLVLAVIFSILRYVSTTALIRMVSGYEAAGERVTVRDGFRLGWSRASFRNWLIDLLFTVVGILVVLLALALVAAPLLLWSTGSDAAGAVGTVMTIGLFILFILVVIVFAAVLSIVLELAYRAVILEGRGVFEGISRGWQIFRRRLGDSIIMGLILFGIGLAFSILMIPVFILLLLAGGVVGGIPALIAGGITSLFTEGATPAVIGALIGLPILIAVLAIPLLFLSGLYETFKSAVWTLTFREMVALEAVAPGSPVPPKPVVTPPAEAVQLEPPAA